VNVHLRRTTVAWAFTSVTVLVCAGLLLTAVLKHPPLPVLPLVIATCVGCPMLAAFELARTLAAANDPARELRRDLDSLPEAPHPLGL
jgi:hypothetical protein